MADPFTWIAIAGTVVSAASSIQQGKVASANAQSQANIADYNAKAAQNTADFNSQVATNNAITARQQATANEEAQRRDAAIQMGKLRAGVIDAGGGLEGTGTQLYGQSLATSELDAKNIMYEGTLKGDSLDLEASNIKRNGQTTVAQYGMNAAQYRSNASSAITGSYLSAAGAAVSGAGSYMNQQSLLKRQAAT